MRYIVVAKFSTPLGIIAERVELKMDGIYKITAKRVFHDIINNTPVKESIEGEATGTAANSWRVFIDTPNNTGPKSANPYASEAHDSVDNIVDNFKTRSNQKVGLENGCGYIGMLDHGLYRNPSRAKNPKTIDGFSTQAPHGIVLFTLLRFPQFVQQARREYGS
jgi:hypothetical protein